MEWNRRSELNIYAVSETKRFWKNKEWTKVIGTAEIMLTTNWMAELGSSDKKNAQLKEVLLFLLALWTSVMDSCNTKRIKLTSVEATILLCNHCRYYEV